MGFWPFPPQFSGPYQMPSLFLHTKERLDPLASSSPLLKISFSTVEASRFSRAEITKWKIFVRVRNVLDKPTNWTVSLWPFQQSWGLNER